MRYVTEVILTILWRTFVTGASVLPLWRHLLTGRRSDLRKVKHHNATFLRGATEDYRDDPLEKFPDAGWTRVIPHWVLIGVPWLMLDLAFLSWIVSGLYPALEKPVPWWATWPWTTIAFYWELVGLLAYGGWNGWRLYVWHRDKDLNNSVIYPAAKVTARVCRYRYIARNANEIIILPNQWEFDEDADEDPPTDDEVSPDVEPVRIVLRAEDCVDPADRKRLITSVSPILGMGSDPNVKWGRDLKGNRIVEIQQRVLPARHVSFEQCRPHLDKVTLDELFAGVAVGGKPVYIKLVGDGPHVLVSAATGQGKSALLRQLMAQRFRAGAYMMVLDFKGVSHLRWCWGMTGVCYAHEIDDIFAKATAVGGEVARRKAVYIEAMKRVAVGEITEDELPKFPSIDVLVEEGNSLIVELGKYWARQRLGPPSQNVAVMALQQAVLMGRELGIHIWWLGQRASADMFGPQGGNIRENFTVRFLSKPTRRTFNMLADGHTWTRWPGGGPGLFWLAKDDGLSTIRVGEWTAQEARDWARGGIEHTPIEEVIDFGYMIPAGPDQVQIEAVPAATLPNPDGPDRKRSFKQLQPVCDQLVPGTTKYAMQQAYRRSRDANEPVPSLAGTVGKGKTAALLFWEREFTTWWCHRSGVPLDADPPRPGIVYAIWTEDPDTGKEELGYIGITRQTLQERLDQHAAEQSWWDLFIRVEVLHNSMYRNHELEALEQLETEERKPVYPFEGQEWDAPHATPKFVAEDEREARDAQEVIRSRELVSSLE